MKARDSSAALQDDSGLKSALSSPLGAAGYCVWSRVRSATGCSPLLLAALAWLVGSVAYGFCHAPDGPMVNGELLEEQLQRRIADIPVPHDSPQYAQYKQYYLRQYQQHMQEYGNAHAQWQQNRPRFNWNALQQALGAGVLVFAAALAYFEYHYGAICYFMELAEEAWESWRERLSKAPDPLADSKKMERFLKEMGEDLQPPAPTAPSAPPSPAAAPACAARSMPEPRKRPPPCAEAKPQLPEAPEPPRRPEPPAPTALAEPPQPPAGTAASEVPTACELPAHPAPGGAARACAPPAASTDPAPAEESPASEAAEPAQIAAEDAHDVSSPTAGPAAADSSAQQPAQPAPSPHARAAAGRPFAEAPPANVRERLRRKVVERHREQIRAVVTQASVPRFAAREPASSAVPAAEAAQARLRASAPAPAAAASPGSAEAPAPPPLAGRELLREAEELLSQLEAEDLLRQLAGEEEKKRQARKKAKRKVAMAEDKSLGKAGAAHESVCSTDLATHSKAAEKLDEMDTTTASDASVVDEGALDGRDEATSHGDGEEEGAEGMAACTSGEEPAGRQEEDEEEEEERTRPAHQQAEVSAAVDAEPSESNEAWSGAVASSAGGAAAAAAQAMTGADAYASPAGQGSSEAVAAAAAAAAAPPAGRALLHEAEALLRRVEQEEEGKRLTRKQAKRKAVANERRNVAKAGVAPVRLTPGPRHSSFLEAAQKAVQAGAVAAPDASALDKAGGCCASVEGELGGWHHDEARALPPAMAAAYEPEMLYPPTPSSSCPGTPRCGAHDDPMAHGFAMGPPVDAMGMVYLPVPVYLVPQVHQFIDLMITDPNGPCQWGMLPGQFAEESAWNPPASTTPEACAPMSSEGLVAPMLTQEGTPLW